MFLTEINLLLVLLIWFGTDSEIRASGGKQLYFTFLTEINLLLVLLLWFGTDSEIRASGGKQLYFTF
ncbi:MAG: hypothetical protein K8F24_01125 [Bacteroidales bacterium]|nr:hypothetical protein [Bacteroidales bacterium]